MLISRLVQSNGRLEIAYVEAERYERLARAARRFKGTPPGTRVRVERNWAEHKAWVILEDLPAWMTVQLEPIRVAPTLRQPTDIVAALGGRRDFAIQSSEANRALRLVDALVRAARARGYRVELTEAPRADRGGYYHRAENSPAQLAISIGVDRFPLTVSQVRKRVPHALTKAEAARESRGGISFAPKFDKITTPHLRVAIEDHAAPFWRSVWSEAETGPLDASLAQILQELELRHTRAEQQRDAAELLRQERATQWQQVRARAIEQLTTAHRGNVLQSQVQQWELAHRIRAYVAAMETRLESITDQVQKQQAQEWLDWAREYAAALDPVNLDLAIPDAPAPAAEALRPFMQGLSPYGPD